MTASLISQAFKKCKKEGRPALLTYTVAGDPTKKISLDILKSISKNTETPTSINIRAIELLIPNSSGSFPSNILENS